MSDAPTGKGPHRPGVYGSSGKGVGAGDAGATGAERPGSTAPGAKGPGDQGPHDFSRRVAARVAQKLRAQRDGTHGVWFGLGMMGLVGWSVVVPTLLGAALGIRIDKGDPGGPSWTLTLLLAGLVLGCVNAWYWVRKEERAMRASQENDDD